MKTGWQSLQEGSISRWLILCLIVLIGVGLAPLKADEAQAPDHKAFITRVLTGNDADLQLWWIRPLNAEWSKLEFRQIDGESRKALLRLIGESKFESNAGDFALLDMEFKDANDLGQGFLVLKRKDHVEGFQFKAATLNKQALTRIVVGKFDPTTKQFNVANHRPDFLDGYVLNGEFREILGVPRYKPRK